MKKCVENLSQIYNERNFVKKVWQIRWWIWKRREEKIFHLFDDSKVAFTLTVYTCVFCSTFCSALRIIQSYYVDFRNHRKFLKNVMQSEWVIGMWQLGFTLQKSGEIRSFKININIRLKLYVYLQGQRYKQIQHEKLACCRNFKT